MPNDQDFVHLHVHTEYSLLDGLSSINKLVARAQELEMSALAITDHGVMFGVVEFFRACKDAGIKPIIGMEAYLARRGMRDRDPQLDNRPYHMLLLARNQTGYQNLLKLASASQLEGYYYRPRIDKEYMAAHAEGLIATSGCLAAEIPRMIEMGKDDAEVRQLIGWYQDVFGPENFFLELQQHDIPELEPLNKWLIANRKYNRVPLLATNDVHYVLAGDHDPHDTLLCIQTNSHKNDVKRMRFSSQTFHLRSQAEMWKFFSEVPEAMHNTHKVAGMCEVDLEFDGYHLPVFPVPEGYTEQTYLRHLCDIGLDWRYGGRATDPEVIQRLEYELGIIHDMGFDTYFLIVWDLCEFSRHADIWWNVRGSGAGSVAAYALGITNIDPLSNGLIFERFLNPGRVSMPDIDLDYPDDRRAEMIEYTVRKYGEDKVAAIITFGTMGSKAAIRDVGRAFDMPLTEVDRVARMLPSGAKPVKFKDALGNDPAKAVPDLKDAYRSDQHIRSLIDTARNLEGVVRHASTHAAGVIVADKPLTEYIPLHRPTKGTGEGAPVQRVTQFDMETCESIGLLKVDFLGLATLTIMRKACELIEQYHGVRYTMDNIPYRPVPDDPAQTRMVEQAFELIGRGETIGIFQVESAGMRKMLTEMRPRSFENIVAAISLYRPGPMDYIPQYNKRLHGVEAPEYKHEKLVPILEETYGIIVYQEQIMQIGRDLFGYSLGDADLMRKAVSKKRKADLLKHKQIFMERGPENGVDPASAEAIFSDIELFANYGFNKAHGSDYAVITCQTAFLKAHYPVEYMTALLSVGRDDTAKVATYTAECRRMTIPILPPDVNRSGLDFTIEETEDGQRGIRYGLAAVKNVGVGPLEHLFERRDEGGAFEDLDDFCHRVDLRQVNKRALESLIKVGALRQFGTRPQHLAVLDRMVSYSAEQHRARDVGQLSLFGETTGVTFDTEDSLFANLPELDEVDEKEMRRWEKELVGLYVTSHPLDSVIGYIQNPLSNVVQTQDIKNEAERSMAGRHATLVGVVEVVRYITTKKGDAMGILTLEDLQGQIELVMFPRTWKKFKTYAEEEQVILVRGKVDTSRGEAQIIVDSISQNFIQATTADEPPSLDLGLPLPDFLQAPEDEVASNGDNGAHEDSAQDDGLGEGVIDPAAQQPSTPLTPDPYIAPASAGGTHHNAPDLVPQVAEMQAPILVKTEARSVTEVPPWEKPPVEESASGLITVKFHRSDDLARDRRRLRRIHGLLIAHPGKDNFCIMLIDGDCEVIMDFPNHHTQHGEALISQLRAVSDVEVLWQSGEHTAR